MTKSTKNIIITFIIGCIIFVIGNLLSGGFNFKNIKWKNDNNVLKT